MLVAGGARVFEREVDHGPAGEAGGEGVFFVQRIGSRSQHFVASAVQDLGARQDDLAGAVQVGPLNQKAEGRLEAVEILSVGQGFLLAS